MESPYVELGQFFTVLYFMLIFVGIPVADTVENSVQKEELP